MAFNASNASEISRHIRENVRSDVEFDIVYSLISREAKRGRGYTYVPFVVWSDGNREAYVLEGNDKNPYYMDLISLKENLRRNGYLVDTFENNASGNNVMNGVITSDAIRISWEY